LLPFNFVTFIIYIDVQKVYFNCGRSEGCDEKTTAAAVLEGRIKQTIPAQFNALYVLVCSLPDSEEEDTIYTFFEEEEIIKQYTT
jgi:hypothetical protein